MILDCAHFTPDEAKGKDRRRDADTEFLPESHPIVKVTTLWAQVPSPNTHNELLT